MTPEEEAQELKFAAAAAEHAVYVAERAAANLAAVESKVAAAVEQAASGDEAVAAATVQLDEAETAKADTAAVLDDLIAASATSVEAGLADASGLEN